ncbi:hypothetical protein [Pontibacterium sp.]|uniref:hypothetical protein n=1 Tax=Pontibacterium sp. TaxID=2036026 RepID=UPI0035133F8C
MIIANSNLSFSTSHAKEQTHREHESLVVQRFLPDGTAHSQAVDVGEKTSLSEEAVKLAKDLGNIRLRTAEADSNVNQNSFNGQILQQPLSALRQAGSVADLSGTALADMITLNPPTTSAEVTQYHTAISSRLSLMSAILVSLTGKPMELFDGRSLNDSVNNAKQVQVGAVQNLSFDINFENFQDNVSDQPMGMRYEHVTSYSEFERTTFSASGEIQTADGQSLQIDLMMEMQHSYSTYDSTVLTAGVQLTDPLIINFDAPAAHLTDEKYGFDINSDGSNEQISFAGQGSGFLMLDKNGDGRANNGNELFGTQSGDGFADLSAYDEDGNGFIDEGDSAYTELKIWVKTASGSNQYFSLADKGIGAIYLGAVHTPFEIKNEQNDLQGVVRGSSFFLREDGSSGTVQQVDLVI